MAATSGSDRGRCTNFEGGKLCSCQLWDPSSHNAYRCNRCECHLSFHKRSNPNRSVIGRCLHVRGEGSSAGKLDGCQEFIATAGGASVCEGCKCHKNYHAQPEVVAEDVACVDGGDESDCDSDGGDRILGYAADEMCNIFVCHAEAQRNFAADLRDDLARCGRRAFLGEDCSNPEKSYEQEFLKVIKKCGVVVLILSKEFFMESKWPMLKLVVIVGEQKSRGRKRRIVPAYYGAAIKTCLDAKDESWSSKLEQWKLEGGNRLTIIDRQKWSQAVEYIKSINGVVMGDGNLEGNFRKKIVEVCRLFGSFIIDDPKVQGKSRLCKEVLDVVYPKELPMYRRAGVRVVGLHGMAGSGKTTLCKILCSTLFKKFDGKVCLADVGSIEKGGSEQELLRNALKRLANLKPALLGAVENSGGMVKYFKREAVFERQALLVVENVTDYPSVMEVARVLKGASLAEGSVVLVTARSLDVLKGLGLEEGDCMSMPVLLEEEAECLFLDSAGVPVGARNGVDENLLKQFLKKCRFRKPGGNNFHYHPFALQLIGRNLPTGGYNPDLWKKKLNDIKDVRKDQGQIFELLRSSFDSLEEEDRLLFMDYALFGLNSEALPAKFAFIHRDGKTRLSFSKPERRGELTLMGKYDWLCMVHGKDVSAMIQGLKRKSFLEGFVVNGQHDIGMHDLVYEFALNQTKIEIGVKRSWFYEPRNCNKLQGSDNVRSVCLGLDGWKGSKTVNLNVFPNAGVMKIMDVVPNIAFRVDELESLKSLEVLPISSQSKNIGDDKEVPSAIRLLGFCDARRPVVPLSVIGLERLHNLVLLRCWNVAYSTCIDKIGYLVNLEGLDLAGYSGEILPNLSKLTKLRILNLRECPSLSTIDLQGLSDLEHLDVDFTNFEKLDVSGCKSLRKVWGLRRNARLEELDLSRCHSLEDLPSLQKCKRLRVLQMPDCRRIPSLRGLSGLRSLKILDITGCEAMAELRGISGCVALEELRALGCKNLTKLPILQNLQVLNTEPETEMVEPGTENDEEEEEEEGGDYEFVVIYKGEKLTIGEGEEIKWGVIPRGLYGTSEMPSVDGHSIALVDVSPEFHPARGSEDETPGNDEDVRGDFTTESFSLFCWSPRQKFWTH